MDQQKDNQNNRRGNRRKRPAAAGDGQKPRPKAFHRRPPKPQRQGQGNDEQTSSSTPVSGPASAAQTPPIIEAAAPPLTVEITDDAPRFADLAADKLVDPILLQTIAEDLKFERMTPVQAVTIRHLIADRGDILAQAKTGTGKTIAFLLPAIQTLLKRHTSRANDVSLLVVSPTRELALQIAKEAQALLQRLPQYKVCTAIGGTNKDTEERRILNGCHILIGTPGRLLDHLTTGGEDSKVRDKLAGVDTLVLDEADRLLDMGFLPSLKQIVGCLPDRQTTPRQGMLFSATIADHVSKVASLALTKDYKFISTIPEGEANTHQRVPQHLVVVPAFSDMAAALIGALRHELAQTDISALKAIIFAPTAGLVDFYTAILEATPGLPAVSTLHSRMTQSKRIRVTDDFRRADSGLLVATDVVARGMDFPSVSNVFQAGIPSDKESYIHRLGRTARAGAEGRGTFVVTEHEAYFPRRVMKDIPFVEQEADLSARESVLRIVEKFEPQQHAKTYQAWLGFYKSFTKQLGWDNERLVQEANTLARDGFAAPETPALAKTIVAKMGLKGTKGLIVVPDPPRAHHGRRPNQGRG